MAILNKTLTTRLLPHVSRRILSFAGHFSATPVDSFLSFIQAQAFLQHLSICSKLPQLFLGRKGNVSQLSALTIPKDSLPNLRSFSGPSVLGPKFIRDRPVRKLALGGHLQAGHRAIWTSLYGLTVNPLSYLEGITSSIWDVHDDTVWQELESLGRGTRELFVRFDFLRRSPLIIPSCFPNVVHLQIESLFWYSVSYNYKPMVFS